MLFLALSLNLLSSYFIASLFGNFLIIFIAFFALIVLNIEILSLFSAINEFNVIILTILNFIISLLFFIFKKPKPLKINFNFKRLKNALLLDKSLIILLFAFLFMLLVSAFFGTIMPPLEPDSQTYHFIRAHEYIKQGSLSHFITNDVRALIMPINSEVFYAWMYLFKKNFHGYGLLSYAAFILTICSMWNIFEKFKFAFRKRLYAIFIFSSFSAIIIQLQSLQTDLVVGSLFIASFALFIRKQILFSSLSFALAMGVKSTGAVGIIAFVILIVLYEILIEKNKKINNTKKFVLFLMPNFLIFSSYNYFLNLFHFHSPFANQAAYVGHKFWGGFRGYIANLIHFSFQSLDFTGFKWGYYLNDDILSLKQKLFDFINIPPSTGCNVIQDKVNIWADEQVVGFGILGFLVFLPMIFKSLVGIFFGRNKKTILFFILALAFIINILILARTTAYMVFSIRFVVAFVCLSSIVLVDIYKKRGFIKPIILFFCLFYMLLISTHNSRMPLKLIYHSLKETNFNLELFEKNCFENKVVDVYKASPRIYETIKEKYSNKKNILFVKSKSSSCLYLKKLENEGYNIDFFPASKLNKDIIKNYDLIILEDRVQDDNIFNPEDIDANYTVTDDTNVIFVDDKRLNCFYYFEKREGKIEAYPLERACFSWQYLSQNKTLKEDYKEIYNLGDEYTNVELIYFIKSN